MSYRFIRCVLTRNELLVGNNLYDVCEGVLQGYFMIGWLGFSEHSLFITLFRDCGNIHIKK